MSLGFLDLDSDLSHPAQEASRIKVDEICLKHQGFVPCLRGSIEISTQENPIIFLVDPS